jgi:hypothetical protein
MLVSCDSLSLFVHSINDCYVNSNTVKKKSVGDYEKSWYWLYKTYSKGGKLLNQVDTAQNTPTKKKKYFLCVFYEVINTVCRSHE